MNKYLIFNDFHLILGSRSGPSDLGRHFLMAGLGELNSRPAVPLRQRTDLDMQKTWGFVE